MMDHETTVLVGTIHDEEEGKLIFIEISSPCGCKIGAKCMPDTTRAIAAALISAAQEVEAIHRGAAGLLAKYLAKEKGNG